MRAFANPSTDGEVAPIAAIRVIAMEPPGSTKSGPLRSRQQMVGSAEERTFGHVRGAAVLNWRVFNRA